MPIRRIAVVLFALLPCAAVAQDIPWQAERVMLRGDGVRAGRPVAGHLVRQGKELSADSLYTVLRADGGLLELGDNLGWVARADVVRMAEATAYFTARIKEEPTAAKWYSRRGSAKSSASIWVDLTSPGRPLLRSGRPAEQLDDLREAVRLAPKEVGRRADLAGMYIALGMLDEAAEECEAIIRLAPQDASSYACRASIRLARKDTAGAVADVERAAELDSMSFGTLNALALIYLQTGQQTKGEPLYRRVAVTAVTTSSDHYQRAVARVTTGGMEGGFTDLTEAVRLNPANLEARRIRGCLLRRMGEYQAALVEFRRVARLQPTDSEAARMEAFLLATCKEDALRDGKRAVELAQKAIKLARAVSSGDLEALAAAYAEVGNFPEAIASQKRAMKALEGQPDFYDEIAGVRWWLTQYEREKPRRE